MSQQQLQKIEITRLSRADEWRRTSFQEPLHCEDGSGQRIVLHTNIRVCPVVQEKFNVFEMVHIRFRHGKIAAFNVAVVRRQIQRSPIAFIGLVHIGAVLYEKFGEPVMPVVCCGQ